MQKLSIVDHLSSANNQICNYLYDDDPTYDANGNLTYDGFHNHQRDAEG